MPGVDVDGRYSMTTSYVVVVDGLFLSRRCWYGREHEGGFGGGVDELTLQGSGDRHS